MILLKIFKKVSVLPLSFLIFLFVQLIVLLLFPEKSYNIYMSIEKFLFTYHEVLIIILLFVILLFSIKNFGYIKKIVKFDKYLLIITIFLIIIFGALLWKGPVFVRLDKAVNAIVAIDQGLLKLFSHRAMGFFFIMHYLSYFIPITFKSLLVVSSVLIIFQSLLVYLILKLLLGDSRMSFWISLLFLFHPNNFLIGRAPDYFLAGQVFGTFSLFTLLLFIKFKDKKILIWSLAILALSLILRVEMVFWLCIYFFILWNSLEKKDVFDTRKIINWFLIIIAPITIAVFLTYFSSPFIGVKNFGNFTDPEQAEIIKNNGHFISGLLSYNASLLSEHVKINVIYLFKYVPLFLIFLLSFFFLNKKKQVLNFFVYFFVFFTVITVFQYNEYVSSFHYLSYLILPLVILFGLIFKIVFSNKTIGKYLLPIFILILIFFNFKFYKPDWVWDDKATIIRNQEYILVHDNESNIENNSAIIVNYRGSIFTGIYGLRNKKVNVVEVNNNIQGQVDYLSDKYDNIYISQGTLACFRDDSNEFFHDQIIKNFKYEIIYYDPKVLIDSGKTCPIFLYKLIF